MAWASVSEWDMFGEVVIYFTLNLSGWREKKKILEFLEHLGWVYLSRLSDIEYWGTLNTQVIKFLLMKNVGLEVYVELLHTNG